ncbi:hypothetical protein ACFQI8_03455 [Haloferax chudinovii]|uniref:Uncharacterized protein n=1 Tax=Haloferax chudinovii TaxID=1109010 RepID=A0ABD5XFS2_9EURY
MVTIELENEIDRWQWRCPRGHTTWEPTNHHFWCSTCAKMWGDDVEPEFELLRNEKTGEVVERDDVVLVTPAGPYDDIGGAV